MNPTSTWTEQRRSHVRPLYVPAPCQDAPGAGRLILRDGTTATIVGQIVCTDAGRWPVQRELNRRIKLRFDALGIEIAIPPQGVVLRQLPANAAAPPPREPPS